ncbi:MAG: hypothetical protein ACR2F6_05850 [Mycobacteriales bacterium]
MRPRENLWRGDPVRPTPTDAKNLSFVKITGRVTGANSYAQRDAASSLEDRPEDQADGDRDGGDHQAADDRGDRRGPGHECDNNVDHYGEQARDHGTGKSGVDLHATRRHLKPRSGFSSPMLRRIDRRAALCTTRLDPMDPRDDPVPAPPADRASYGTRLITW